MCRTSGTWNRSYDLSLPARRSAVIKISLACDLDRVLRSFTARPSLCQSIQLLFCLLLREYFDGFVFLRFYDPHHAGFASAAFSLYRAAIVLKAGYYCAAIGTMPPKYLPLIILCHLTSSPCKPGRFIRRFSPRIGAASLCHTGGWRRLDCL